MTLSRTEPAVDGLLSVLPADDEALRGLLAAVAPLVVVGHDLGEVLVRPGSAIPALALRAELDRVLPGAVSVHGIRTRGQLEAALDDIRAARTVLVNGLGFFQTAPFRAFLDEVAGKAMFVLLHETAFAVDAAQERHPVGLGYFWRDLPRFNTLFLTRRQQEWYRGQVECRGAVVGNAVIVPPGHEPLPARPASSRARVVNVATIQDRKGPVLFDAVARLAAEQGLDMDFVWVGRRTSWIEEGFEFSDAVTWVDHVSSDEVLKCLSEADVFFLSSVDDPLPLSVTEAAHQGCRIVSYTEPGCHEILEDRPGYRSFDVYEPQAALTAIRDVLTVDHTTIEWDDVVEAFTPRRFAARTLHAMARDHDEAVYPGPQSAYEWVRPHRHEVEQLLEDGRLDEAERRIAFLRRATEEFEPTEVLASRLEAARGDLEQAVHHARLAVTYNPRSRFAHGYLGDLLAETGDPVGAALSFGDGLRCGTDTKAARSRLKEAVDRALAHLEESTEPFDALRPEYVRLCALVWFTAEVPYRYAMRLKGHGHLHEALAQVTWASRLAPARARYHLERALLAEALDDRTTALRSYRRALELNPESAAAKSGCARTSR